MQTPFKTSSKSISEFWTSVGSVAFATVHICDNTQLLK